MDRISAHCFTCFHPSAMTIRAINQLIGFLVGILIAIGIFAPYAHAETISATQTSNPKSTRQVSWNSTIYGTEQSGLNSMCNAWRSSWGYGTWGTDYFHTDNGPKCCSTSSGGSCVTPTGSGTTMICASGSTWNGTSCIGYICPSDQNWTLSGTSCTRPDCVSPAVRISNGTCSTTCPAGQVLSSTGCKDCTQVSAYGDYRYSSITISGKTGACVGSPGQSGCFLPETGSLTACVGGTCVGKLAAGTGANCVVPLNGNPVSDPNPVGTETPQTTDPANDTNKCTSQGMTSGTVNGVVTCVPASNSTPVTTSKQTVTTAPDGTVTTKKETTTCIGTQCTTKTENFINGTSQGTTTEEGNKSTASPVGSAIGESKDDLNDVLRACAERPDLPICQDFCKRPENSEKAQCKDLGEATIESEPETKTMGVNSVTVESFGGTGSCPAPIPLPYNTSLSFDWTCQLLQAINPMLIALAWLSAGLIVMGAFRDG